jgi:NADH:ubiquinone oxidoreductase subunit 6 (subunit J)
MTLTSFMFYFFVAVTALSAVGLVLVRNVFYGALLIIVCLLALAGIYVLAFAEFVAITQILIYAGGILVVIIFGIMLTTKISQKPLAVEHTYIFAGIVAAGACFALFVYALSKESFTQLTASVAPPQVNGIDNIGISLFSNYVLPFEMAGLLLLIALIGAAVIASSVKSRQ